jgi:hypothetical protein
MQGQIVLSATSRGDQLQAALDQPLGIEHGSTHIAVREVGGVHYLRFMRQIAA